MSITTTQELMLAIDSNILTVTSLYNFVEEQDNSEIDLCYDDLKILMSFINNKLEDCLSAIENEMLRDILCYLDVIPCSPFESNLIFE
jgi:hemerythrin-like domain-containing protein